MALPEEIPLFPLDVVLMPRRRLPLHIFEPRYRQLISACIRDEKPYGMVCGSDDSFCEIGCAGQVAEVIHRFEDGRLNIITLGTERFRVVERIDDDATGCVRARVEPYTETRNDVPKDLGDRVFDLYHEALRRSLGWYQPPEVRDVDFFDLSFDIACNMQLTNEEQQLLLELTDTRERLQAEEKLLEMAIAELDRRLSTFGANGHISLN